MLRQRRSDELRHSLQPGPFTTAENTSTKILFSSAAAHGWPIEHMYTKHSCVHKPAGFDQPVHVK